LINCTFFLGYTAKDSSFYASLHAEFSQQDRVISQTNMESNATIEYRLVELFLIQLHFRKGKRKYSFYFVDQVRIYQMKV
jgi:hypothetical protein